MNNKLVVGGAAAAIMTIIVWAAKQWGHIDVPPEVSAAGASVISLLAAHFTPAAPSA